MTATQPQRPYGAMQARAARAAGARADPMRVRLCLPLTPLFILLSPFALLLALTAFLPARLFGVNAFAVAWAVGGLLLSLGGTLVEVDDAATSIRIKIV